MALMVNLVRNPKKTKPAKPADFNPYIIKPKMVIKAPLTVLRDVFVKNPSVVKHGRTDS